MSPPDPLPSDEAVEALTNHLQSEWAGPYMARIRDFTEAQIEAGDLRAADQQAHEEAKAVAKRALTAAYRIDMPRREAEIRAATREAGKRLDGVIVRLSDENQRLREDLAEVRAATLREVSAWLEEADPYVARDFAVYLNPEAE